MVTLSAAPERRVPDPVERARLAASRVPDPELPMLTLTDLGILRDVSVDDDGTVVAAITPTYSGCPAMATMRDDLLRALQGAGFAARVRIVLDPPWSSDWITPHGRAALAGAGISPPGPAPHREGPV
ncbi:MAG: 1,2-phenylacetyl-CoA epoxidase subunit PaaD, partial [Microbacterium sp.]